MKEDGEPVPKPLGAKKYKGNITLRVPSELHRALVMSSAEEGVSLNQYILSKIAT
jgi:predicted HicB family RNase H-like nuclease